MSTSGDGGDDADFVAVLYGGVEVLEEPDVFLVDVNVDEAPKGAGVVKQPFFDAGKAALQVGKSVSDSAGFDVNQLFVVGELSQRRGDADCGRHGGRDRGVGVME